jgi:pilus assembly protein Flp/PilA
MDKYRKFATYLRLFPIIMYNIELEIILSFFNIQRKEVNTMFKKLQKKGQGLVEYALILVLVAIVIIIILSVLGPAIGNVFSQIIHSI